MPDIIDEERDILYCSKECALEDGAREEDLAKFSSSDWDAAFTEMDDGAEMPDYGCLCPVCGDEYQAVSDSARY